MADPVKSSLVCSRNMAAIRGKVTDPEVAVRKMLHAMACATA